MAPAPTAAAAAHTYGEMVSYPMIFPVAGDAAFTDTFYAARYNGQHHAQDLMAAKMTPVVAPVAGRIEFVNWSSNPNDLNPEKCCSLSLRHDDGWQSYYIHLNNDTPGTDDGAGWGIADGLVPGVHVEAGEVIGWVGDSGNAESTAPHLHFELRDPDGVIVNPYNALLVATGIEVPPPVCVGGNGEPLNALLSGTRVLRRGMTGGDVSELQGFLNSQGLGAGPVDGSLGRRTFQAVQEFQRRHDIEPDGVVGAETRAAIQQIADRGGFASLINPEGRILRPGEAQGPAVRALQKWLRVLGYDPGPVDAVYGTMTSRAVASFQEDTGIRVDGKVGATTRAALAEALGLIAPACG